MSQAQVEKTEGRSKKVVYLACPYSHPDRTVRLTRFSASNLAASLLMNRGQFIFAPISHTHPIAERGDLELGWEFWKPYDRAMLECCGKVVVLMIDGWKESKGVSAEIGIAEEMGLPVEYLDPLALAPADQWI